MSIAGVHSYTLIDATPISQFEAAWVSVLHDGCDCGYPGAQYIDLLKQQRRVNTENPGAKMWYFRYNRKGSLVIFQPSRAVTVRSLQVSAHPLSEISLGVLGGNQTGFSRNEAEHPYYTRSRGLLECSVAFMAGLDFFATINNKHDPII